MNQFSKQSHNGSLIAAPKQGHDSLRVINKKTLSCKVECDFYNNGFLGQLFVYLQSIYYLILWLDL